MPDGNNRHHGTEEIRPGNNSRCLFRHELRWNTEKNLGLQTELNFSQQGWDEQFDEHPTYKYTRTINYLEIPFFTHIYFGSNKFKFYVNMGPKVGFAIGEKTDLNPDEKNQNAGANNRLFPA